MYRRIPALLPPYLNGRNKFIQQLLEKRAVMSLCCKMSSSSSEFVRNARLAEKIRADADCCRSHLPGGRFMIFNKGKPMRTEKNESVAWVDLNEATRLSGGKLEESFAFLGLDEADGSTALFAVNVTSDDGSVAFTDMRMALFSVQDPKASGMMQQAYSLLRWHRRTRFCSSCGSAGVERSFSGHQITCGDCSASFYPSPAPCGIVLIESPDHSQVLLIRQSTYPPGMYSCIAGFVDMGESVEECVRREVAEEAGVQVEAGSVEVMDSDHWPFPAGSLMVGCIAKVDPDALSPDPSPEEVEEARWFTVQELLDAFNAVNRDPGLRLKSAMSKKKDEETKFVPPRQTLSHQLIRAWLLRHGHIELKSGL
jgi:NADH pyrophosphatase NudC (nudix superfamily)